MFSTDGVRVQDRFRRWREVSRARLPPFEMWTLGDKPFEARWEEASIGSLRLSRTAFSAHSVQHTACTASQSGGPDTLACVIRLSGTARGSQHGRAACQQPGSLTVFDTRAPLSASFDTPMRTLQIEVPRERFEGMLGSVSLYAALPMSGDLPGVSLARTFFDELVRVHEHMSPDMAGRMSAIGVDLLVASIAERMLRDTPRPLQGTVTVQRAKAYVEAHLHDPCLDPPRLAAAVGVSLRRLQELFHARGRHVSDWIWARRLEKAAQRLADPGYAHLSIGALAYSCGFANQSHFSKRFRDRFGATPTEHRRAALRGPASGRSPPRPTRRGPWDGGAGPS